MTKKVTRKQVEKVAKSLYGTSANFYRNFEGRWAVRPFNANEIVLGATLAYAMEHLEWNIEERANHAQQIARVNELYANFDVVNYVVRFTDNENVKREIDCASKEEIEQLFNSALLDDEEDSAIDFKVFDAFGNKVLHNPDSAAMMGWIN